ncbi:tRNA preQ1(34) S-adenosylmethionine ribosyltransferase-isomerase QueA [Patescibacteria group bacterium]|nr:tRNA preQ1(34) S-adenosylmethionine ribosyltransferase-isomerase QueA [Patescibacteria group bacterium]
MDLDRYDYFLPKNNIALKPATPRDSSKLFVYDTAADRIVFDKFYNLDKYLPKDSFLVLNNTKVIPARVEMKKQTGGKVIVLFLVSESVDTQTVKAMVDRKVNVGEKLYFDPSTSLRIKSQEEHIFELGYDFSKEKLFQLLEKYGSMPIPLYLKKTPLKRDELMEKYQTIFAKERGSSAAPTASLHFSRRVFEKLEKKDINRYFITLHVGLGTFAPLTQRNISTKRLHEEYFEVDEQTLHYINIMKSEGKKLVAVGTTVTRTLESLAKTGNLVGNTDLFIYPPYEFKMVDCLITNFHLPKSSLMMLVEAFLQYRGARRHLIDLYKTAIDNDFRFYSFGDAMMIL